jgi:hypothetical protein
VEGIAGHCKGPVYVFQDENALLKLIEEHPDLQKCPQLWFHRLHFSKIYGKLAGKLQKSTIQTF